MLAGVTVPAGAELVLDLTANGGDPHSIDYALAFGVGLHRCVGAKPAEREAGIIVEECTAALPSMRPTESGDSLDSVRLLSLQAPASVVVSRGDAEASSRSWSKSSESLRSSAARSA